MFGSARARPGSMPEKPGVVVVAAGVNGAGKSTIIGRYIEKSGGAYYNPDARTRALIKAGLREDDANARSWQEGFDALKQAIDDAASFTFETTLGGKSIAAELFRALALGRDVTIYYVGLKDVDLHIQRVAARVKRGGHDIPEQKIRERITASRENLLNFIGTQASIRIWDNSDEDPNGEPMPVEVLSIQSNRLLFPDSTKALRSVPIWAKALVKRAMDVCKIPDALKRPDRPIRRNT